MMMLHMRMSFHAFVVVAQQHCLSQVYHCSSSMPALAPFVASWAFFRSSSLLHGNLLLHQTCAVQCLPVLRRPYSFAANLCVLLSVSSLCCQRLACIICSVVCVLLSQHLCARMCSLQVAGAGAARHFSALLFAFCILHAGW
jgi:hypothetical protein